MGLRDLIKKKDRLGEGDAAYSETLNRLAGPEFTFIRSDTNTHEIIYPPSHPKNDRYLSAHEPASTPSKSRRSLDVFRPRSRGNSLLSAASGDSDGDSSTNGSATKKDHRRLSHRLGLSRHPKTSEFVPNDLPQINVTSTADGPPTAETKEAKEVQEQQWEKRATILASTNEERQRSRSRSVSVTPSISYTDLDGLNNGGGGGGGGSAIDTSSLKALGGVVSSKEIDQDIQEAIRLHEEGDLERSTQLFGRLADPDGANNPLSQVLYGLALRHGWGCEPDVERALTYLSAAASNAASVETLALKAGVKKGGAAKGELVLAIFELANCFRHGWGIAKDPVAAKQYYETAANLGDTDAMNEAAWCYLEGFGCKKDKVRLIRHKGRFLVLSHARAGAFLGECPWLGRLSATPRKREVIRVEKASDDGRRNLPAYSPLLQLLRIRWRGFLRRALGTHGLEAELLKPGSPRVLGINLECLSTLTEFTPC